MKLRARLVVGAVVVAIPQVAALTAWDLHARRLAAEDGLRGLLPTYLTAEGRLACAADPAGWGGALPPPPGPPPGELAFDPATAPSRPHGKAPVLRAYSADGAPADPALPPIAPDALPPGAIHALSTPWYGADVAVGTRTGWPGGCAIAVLEGSTAAGWLGAILPATPLWLVPMLGCVLGVLAAAGPPVERIRRLTQTIMGVAADGYRAEIEAEGDDEIAALARAFDDAAREIRRRAGETALREQALREFVANTNHDVVLPLTVLQGHLAALKHAPGDARLVGAAMQEAHYLGALLQDLAAAADLDVTERAIVRRPVDLCALVDRVASRHQAIAKDRGIEVVHALPGSPLVVPGEVTLLEQAVNNLVYNAVRYTLPGGHVAVVLVGDADQGFAIQVIDDGPGVDERLLQRLAERGFRTDEARSRSPDGRGLGLSIVQRVAAAHGFTLTFARSEFGGVLATLAGR